MRNSLNPQTGDAGSKIDKISAILPNVKIGEGGGGT
jgi:hypothetical protein